MSQEAGTFILPKITGVLDAFYEWLPDDPTASPHKPPTSASRVKKMQGSYGCVFFAGQVNSSYISDRQRINRAHAIIGLPAGLYFSSMVRLKGMFSTILYQEAPDQDHLLDAHISRQINLDATLVLEAPNAQGDLLNRQLVDDFGALSEIVQMVVAGDLTRLADSMGTLSPKMRQTILPLQHSMESIAH